VLLTRSLFQQRTFFRLTDRLYRARTLAEGYEVALDAITELLGCERASILRFDNKGVMRFVAWRGLSDGYREAVAGHSPWRPGDRDPEPIFVPDIALSSESARIKEIVAGEGIAALGFIPLTSNLLATGKFMFYHAAPHDFEPEEREIALMVARQLGFFIERQTADLAASRLTALIESSDDAIVSKNLDGVIQSWNAGAERLFGYSAEEVIDRPITILIPDDRLDEETLILSRIRKGERVDHYETVRRRKDGRLIHVSLTVSPIFDGNGNVLGASKIARDVTAQHLARERQQLLLREMNHRVKNLFSVTSSIVSVKARTAASAQELAAAVIERLDALGRAHALTMAGDRPQADHRTTLHELTRAILAPYDGKRSRLSISGDDLGIDDKAVTPIALLFHEFATNAAKYGSLSNDTGRVALSFALHDDVVKILWSEIDGPQVSATSEQGFGSRLVEATAAQLGGHIEREWATDGLRIRLNLARQSLHPA
jgi:PAS domain S-box-containing protein